MLPTLAHFFPKPQLKRQRPFPSGFKYRQQLQSETEEFMDVVDYAETQNETGTHSKKHKSDDRVQVVRRSPLEITNAFAHYHVRSDILRTRKLYKFTNVHGRFDLAKSRDPNHVGGTRNLSLFSNQSTPRKQSFIVTGKEMRAFFRLLDDEVVQDFLEADSCMKISDKYLIAMVFAYFKRADMNIREYTRTNFFVALYLGNDMEEDEEEDKYEIFPWALGQKWQDKFPRFLHKKDLLWSRINYMALVSKICCEEIMAIDDSHPIWKRSRQLHHAGAIRSYAKYSDGDGYPRGPCASHQRCPDCDNDSPCDSASLSSASWYISGDSSPESDDVFDVHEKSRFDMNNLGWNTGEHANYNQYTMDAVGLKKKLETEDNDAWSSVEE